MAFPGVTYRELLPDAVRQEFDQFTALLEGYLAVQHKDDGSHGAITADSVEIENAGALTLRDETNPTTGALGTTTTLSRTQADGTVLQMNPRPTGDKPYLTISATFANAMAKVLRLGVVGTGAYSTWPGIRLDPSAVASGATDRRPWDMLSLHHGDGQALAIGDVQAAALVAELFYDFAGASYAWRPALGSGAALGTNSSGLRWSNCYLAGSYYEHARSAAMGDWTAVAFNAGNFTADVGSWTVGSGDVIAYRYTLVGHTMTVSLALDATTVAGGPGALKVAVPAGMTIANNYASSCAYLDNGTPGTGVMLANAGASVIAIEKDLTGAAWAAATNTTFIYGQMSFEVA